MKRVFVIAALLFLSICSSAFASNSYVGLDYSFVNYEPSGFPDADVGAVSVKGGTYLGQYWAIEARAGLGVSDDTINASGTEVEFEIDSILGLYLRGEIPLERVKPFVTIGYSRLEATATVLGDSQSDDESDLSYGFGLDVMISDQVSMGAEYLQLIDKSEIDFSTINLGLKYHF